MEENKIDLANVFKNNIRIEPKVMAIETLFNNKRRMDKTDYKPPYQRNYVWDDEKASYFIESILLGTEIPPLIFFNSGEKIEVIDGRQRYETIYRFLNNGFKLRKSGLHKFIDLNNKNFDDLGELKDVIWDTKLRIIEFSFLNRDNTQQEIEEIVKKEIFKRYNSGITPLSVTEVDNAKYIEDGLNEFIKDKLKKDKRLYTLVKNIFIFEKKNIETLLKKIRQLMVIHLIPIRYYAAEKDKVVNRFYENFSNSLESEEDINIVFNSFIEKINFLDDIRKHLEKLNISTNRLIFECLYWALSVIDNEGVDFKLINTPDIKRNLSNYLIDNIDSYKMEVSSFAPQILRRYETTSSFFTEQFNISFNLYLKNHDAFKSKNKELNNVKTDPIELSKFESLRLNKPDASSNAIDDICRLMERQRFLIRPTYQRKEVINKNKSSAIIESILLGIKLPPIFVFKRGDDGVREVVDGQQRLLSILGFLGKKYLDENNKLTETDKHLYSLNLKNSILKELHGKNFSKLPKEFQDRILDYDLWVIEIDEKNNEGFDPVDLFLRLNYKPYPIKENTFEMWNSYVDRDIINKIKSIYKENSKWLFLRKNNTRMENEGLVAFLIYLFCKTNDNKLDFDKITDFLDIYKVGRKINLRIKSKTDITKTLDNPTNKSLLFKACDSYKDSFVGKIEVLLFDEDVTENDKVQKFNYMIDSDRRTYQLFYTLWIILLNISLEQIKKEKVKIIEGIRNIIISMDNAKSVDEFKNNVINFWNSFK